LRGIYSNAPSATEASKAGVQEKRSKIKVEALLREKKATLWIQHNIIQFATLKKSPAYYD